MTTIDRRRVEFGGRLRRLRDDSGLSGRELADQLGWVPSKISKLETRRQLATDSDVTEWCDATGAPESVAAELLDALIDLRDEYDMAAPARQPIPRPPTAGRHRRAECRPNQGGRLRRRPWSGPDPRLRQARAQPSCRSARPGPRYRVAVAVRMARQSVLYDTSKTVEILVAEAALRYPVAPPEVMAAQLDRLTALIGMPSIQFGVLPLDRPMPYMPMYGFWLLDDVALVENITAEIRIEDASEVTIFHKFTDQLWKVAAEREDARAVLGRVRTTLD